jgi:uncharacterized protein YeaO (DUF488 family)
LPVKTKRVYDPPSSEDGVRILVMRFYPRGVKRETFHEWRKELGTDPELIRAWKSGAISWDEFARRYEAQISADPKAQASLNELAQRARKETLTLLCACEDEAHCHRTLLKAMIERRIKRARNRFSVKRQIKLSGRAHKKRGGE